MQYNSWLEAPFSGSFTVIADSNNNHAIGMTFKYDGFTLDGDENYANIGKGPYGIGMWWFYIHDLEFDYVEKINNKKLNKIIHDL